MSPLSAQVNRSSLLLVALVLLVVAAMWSPALLNGYTLDDDTFVRVETPSGPNVMVQELRPLPEYFTRPYGHGAASVSRGFRPLTVLSYALTYRAFRQPADGPPGGFTDDPWPHHLVNLLLHLLATLLVYAMLVRLTVPGRAALLATLVFGVHALRAEAVVSIVGRGELLGFVLGAGSALAWARGQESEKARPAWLGLAALGLFAAFSSKENAVAWTLGAPLFALACARIRDAPRGKTLRGQALTTLAVAGLPLAGYLALRANMLAAQVAPFEALRNPIFAAEWGVRLRTGVTVLGYGLFKILWPFRLVCDYGARVFEPVGTWWDVRFLTAAALLLGLFGGFVFALRRAPLPAVAVGFFLGWAFLTSNIAVPIETIFGERLLYTPAVGLCFLVAWAAPRLRGRAAPVMTLLLALWIGANLWTGLRRSLEWRDNPTLILTDAERQPRSIWLALQAAHWNERQDNTIERERHLSRALVLDADCSPALVAMFEARAGEAFRLERQDAAAAAAAAAAFAEAERWGRRALGSSRLDPLESQATHQNLAAVLTRLGRLQQARVEHAAAIALAPATRVALRSRAASAWLAYAIDGSRALPEIREFLSETPPDLPAEQRLALGALTRAMEGMAALDAGDPKRARQLLIEGLDGLERNAPDLVRPELTRALALAADGERSAEARGGVVKSP